MHQMLSEKVPNKDIAEAPEGTPYLSEYDWGYDEKTIGWDQAEVADKEDQEEYYHKLQFLILILLHVIFDIITQKNSIEQITKRIVAMMMIVRMLSPSR